MSRASEINERIAKLSEKSEYKTRQAIGQMIIDRITRGTGIQVEKAEVQDTWSVQQNGVKPDNFFMKRLRFKKEDENFWFHPSTGTVIEFITNTEGNVLEIRVDISEQNIIQLLGYDTEVEALTSFIKMFGEQAV